MDKTVKRILWCSLATLLVVGIIGVALLYKPGIQSSLGSVSNAKVNLIGTRVGTSTTGVDFGTATSTTFYPVWIGSNIDTAIINIRTTAVRGGSNSVNFEVLKSNDASCYTATTTTVLNAIVTGDINWYDAGYNLKDLAGTVTIPVATTTFTWYPTAAKQGKNIVLKDLGVNCIGLNVTASGTTLYAELITKEFN